MYCNEGLTGEQVIKSLLNSSNELQRGTNKAPPPAPAAVDRAPTYTHRLTLSSAALGCSHVLILSMSRWGKEIRTRVISSIAGTVLFKCSPKL